ncbi:hypothetical protein BJF85_15700 [Saccharomonospora sp. CUA-673]|uniref:hypothetical protein n=1 Tax=Saccharomonospora sp. CUA-673 TaxID=1904969 RepID=UPI00095DC716|nr:hypothetical protein [Saccharomonospora sp. CUA-673]OLT46681.1 hypothetical protein BJF85_15700 [Saccharomonospora sp. CUA-673]
MSPDALPSWLPTWCLDHLGSRPDTILFRHRSISDVVGLRLVDGTELVVKARPEDGRAASCVAAQSRLAEMALPCPRPLTHVDTVGALAVHAEEFRPGGDVLHGAWADVAVRCAHVFADLMAGLASVRVTPPLPNPRWVRWDHAGTQLWPPIDALDEKDQNLVPSRVTTVAARARRRLLAADLPCVLGHADFEAQNLRWRGRRVWMVHDWDSLAWQPEAALVGAASVAFPKTGAATLPPLDSTEAFLNAYQAARGRAFTAEEEQLVWAAGLWVVTHDLRWEALHDRLTTGAPSALQEQAPERLRRADA